MSHTNSNIAMIGDKAATTVYLKNGSKIYIVELSILDDNNRLVRQLKLYDSNKQYIKTIHNDVIEMFGIPNILSTISDCYDWVDVFSYCVITSCAASREYGLNKRDKDTWIKSEQEKENE